MPQYHGLKFPTYDELLFCWRSLMSFDCKRHNTSYTHYHKFTTFKSNENHRHNVDVVWMIVYTKYYSLMMQLVEVSLCKR